MNASTTALLGVALGATISAAATIGGGIVQERRARRRWRDEQTVRQIDAEFALVADYLAAVGTWKTQLSRLWQHSRGLPSGTDGLDAAAAGFFRSHFSAYIIVEDERVKTLVKDQQPELNRLYELAVTGCEPDVWTDAWRQIDRSAEAIADAARRSRSGRRTAAGLRTGPPD